MTIDDACIWTWKLRLGFLSSTQPFFFLFFLAFSPSKLRALPFLFLAFFFFLFFPYTWLYPNKSIKMHTLYLLPLFLSFPLPTPCVFIMREPRECFIRFFDIAGLLTLQEPTSSLKRIIYHIYPGLTGHIIFLVATIFWTKLEFSPTIYIFYSKTTDQ